jgi:hypothetical protein
LVCYGSRLCENSNAELSRRTFVSITLNKKRNALARTSKEEKIENNSAHSPRVGVFTQPGSRAAVAGRLMAQPVYPKLRKYPVRSGTYASCQQRTNAVPVSRIARVWHPPHESDRLLKARRAPRPARR